MQTGNGSGVIGDAAGNIHGYQLGLPNSEFAIVAWDPAAPFSYEQAKTNKFSWDPNYAVPTDPTDFLNFAASKFGAKAIVSIHAESIATY